MRLRAKSWRLTFPESPFASRTSPLMREATTFEAMEHAGYTRSTMTSHYTVVALTRREQAVRRAQEGLFGSQEKKGLTVASLLSLRNLVGPPRFELGTSFTPNT